MFINWGDIATKAIGVFLQAVVSAAVSAIASHLKKD